MVYGYIRVSSDKQTVENQRFEINKFCERENLTIDGWIEETISGTKAYNKRQLGALLKRIKKDDLIICAELSRLGRNLFMIMEILNICMTKETKVWTIRIITASAMIFSQKYWHLLLDCRLRLSAILFRKGQKKPLLVKKPKV